jgi:hypothetical protein
MGWLITFRDGAAAWLPLLFALLLVSGCTSPLSRRPPRPGRTTLNSPQVVLPAQLVGNYLLIEVKWDRNGPYNFLIDTGSSVTLVTPALARRVIFVTGDVAGTDAERFLDETGCRWLSKPFRLGDLLRSARDTLS